MLWQVTGISVLVPFLDSARPLPAALLVIGTMVGLLVTASRLRSSTAPDAPSLVEAVATVPLAMCLVLAQVVCWWGGTNPAAPVRTWAAASVLAMALAGAGRIWAGTTSAAWTAAAQAALALTVSVTGVVPPAAALPATAAGLTCCVFAALTA